MLHGVQGIRDAVMAYTADSGSAELVGNAITPLASKTLVAVLGKNTVAGLVIDIVYRFTSRKFFVYAVTFVVIAINVCVFMHHLLSGERE